MKDNKNKRQKIKLTNSEYVCMFKKNCAYFLFSYKEMQSILLICQCFYILYWVVESCNYLKIK